MYKELGTVRLKSGKEATAGVVRGPDAQWAERLDNLLGHKGSYWSWHIAKAAREELPIETRFYLLHDGTTPFSNMMTIEVDGVGILGHVFTLPSHRRQGAASQLMKLLMEEFRGRGGRTLFLATGYDSPPFHIYRQCGFEGIEAGSGVMCFEAPEARSGLAAWFSPGEIRIEPLGWRHLPLASPLLAGPWPGVVRLASWNAIGRVPSEAPLLSLLHDAWRREALGLPPRASVLVNETGGAVCGIAAWGNDRLWPRTAVVDVYCHPDYWSWASDLLAALSAPENVDRVIAYADGDCPARRQAMEEAGFSEVARLPNFVAADAARSRCTTVTLLEQV